MSGTRISFSCVPPVSDEETFVWSDLAKQLRALDRYERRALSRRKRASEDLDTIRILDMERAWYNFKE